MILTPEEAEKIRVALEFTKRVHKAILGDYAVRADCEIAIASLEEAVAVLSKPEPRPMRSAEDDTEVMRFWRECGLPEYFLGNGGSNHRLVKFFQRIQADALASRPDVAGWKRGDKIEAQLFEPMPLTLERIRLIKDVAEKSTHPIAFKNNADVIALCNMALSAAPSGKGEARRE